MHSECITGDVFHSSRCDYGEQLDETINLMKDQGGIILYLRQEGRGIGLYNKMDAYVLQSQGMDTYKANKHLGSEEDARNFEESLSCLNFASKLWGLFKALMTLAVNEMVNLTSVDKSDVLAKIEKTVIDFFTQVMKMDSFTLRQEGIE